MAASGTEGIATATTILLPPKRKGQFELFGRNAIESKQSPWPQRLLDRHQLNVGDAGEGTLPFFTAVQIKRDNTERNLLGGTFDQIAAMGWGFIDSITQACYGYSQLKNPDHHMVQNRVKGVLSIGAGLQGLLLTNTNWLHALGTALGGSASSLPSGFAWAGWAFAGSMWVDWLCTTIDFYNAAKKTDFKGWLEDKVNEAIYLQKEITKGVQVVANTEKLQVVLAQIKVRCRVHFNKQNQQHQVDVNLQAYIESQLQKLIRGGISEVSGPDVYSFAPGYTDPIAEGEQERFEQHDQALQKQAEDNCKSHLVSWVAKTVTTTGATLCAVCPEDSPGAEAGQVLFYIAAAYYGIKLLAMAGLLVKDYCQQKSQRQAGSLEMTSVVGEEVSPPKLEETRAESQVESSGSSTATTTPSPAHSPSPTPPEVTRYRTFSV